MLPTLALTLLLALSSCGEDQPEVTIEDRLESIAGTDLTPAEIQRQLEVADTLCQSEAQVLENLWASMSARQLRFQDYVFAEHCPGRSVEYATATGRALTVEAHEVLTETDSTTSTTGSGSTGQTLPLPDSLVSTTQP